MLETKSEHWIRWLCTLVVISATPLAPAQLTDPCEQQGCGDQTVPAGSEQLDALEEAWLDIGDIDGDGVPDYVFYDPDLSAATIQVFSGGSDEFLMELFGGPGDAHWFSIIDAGDINGDGVPEISAAVVHGTPDALAIRFAVYDGTDGRLFAYLIPSENPDGSYTLTPVLLADVNMSGVVESEDMLIVASAVANGVYDAPLDMNQDQGVDGEDLLIVAFEMGSTGAGGGYDFSGLIDTILSSEGGVESPEFETVFVDNRDATPIVQAGIIGCFFCGLRCRSALNKAWDCRRKMWEATCDCFCKDDGSIEDDLFKVAECLNDVKTNFLPQCLQDVIDSVPACAKCIKKCGPKPTVGS